MAESNNTENGATEIVETVQASAGSAQRAPALAALANALTDATAPTAEELDARQQAIGLVRRSGPPLADVVDTLQAFAVTAADAQDAADEPTEVDEPRKRDQ